MTKYTRNKHGLILGYAGTWFSKSTGEMQIFPATVWLESYDFDEVNIATVRLMTPAEQLVWVRREVAFPIVGPSPFYSSCEIVELHPLVKSWLDSHAPGWDLSPVELNQHLHRQIFFSKVAHARDFVKYISGLLAGIRIG